MGTPRTPATQPELRLARAKLVNVEWRDASKTGDGSLTMSGHAAVFDEETELFDLGFYRMREKVARGAFTDVLAAKPDVHLTIGHDFDKSMARTGVEGVGALELEEDDVGLRVFARVDPELSFVRDLEIQSRHGIVDQMSFLFDVGHARYETEVDDDTGKETETREILEVSALYDVTVTALGAYATTDMELRAMRSRALDLGLLGTKRTRRKAEARGEELAAVLDDAIEALLENEDLERDDVTDELAEAAGIDVDQVDELLDGDGDCPTRELLDAFAGVLDTDAEPLVEAAEADGCTFDDDDTTDDNEDEDEERGRCRSCGRAAPRRASLRPKAGGRRARRSRRRKKRRREGGLDERAREVEVRTRLMQL